jgi:hypothetical protein
MDQVGASLKDQYGRQSFPRLPSPHAVRVKICLQIRVCPGYNPYWHCVHQMASFLAGRDVLGCGKSPLVAVKLAGTPAARKQRVAAYHKYPW